MSVAAAKFLIGVTAGLCSALFPRLVPAMTGFAEANGIFFLSWGYIALSVLFAVLIGVVVMILEWGIVRKPRDTFMAALGIPALLTGVLNTTDATNNLVATNDRLTAVTEQLSDETGIPIISAPRSMEPLAGKLGSAPERKSTLRLLPIRPAYGSGGGEFSTAQASFDPRIQVRQPRFVVVIEKAETAEKATARAKELRESGVVPEAQAVRSGDEFLIIQGGAAQTKTEALLDAIRLKKERALKPSLMELEPGSSKR